MFKELKEDWSKMNTLEKIVSLSLLPFSILIGIFYGLFLLFWNKYGLTFVCGMVMILIFNDERSPEIVLSEAGGLALIISAFAFLYKEFKK